MMMMNPRWTTALTGAAVGLVLTTAMCKMAEHPMQSRRRAKRLKKTAGRALSNVSAMMDELSGWVH